MIYLKEPNTNRIVEFQDEALIGISFEGWIRLNEEESLIYELQKTKEERKNQLKSNRQAFQYSNFIFEENIYKASESAQNKLANKIQTVSQSGNALFSWNDAFDEVIALELSEAQELLAAIIAREDFAYSNYAEKLKEIEACTTLEELNNININFN